jgi:hypothetical protein
MHPFFTRAILACKPAIFDSPNRAFGHFRHDATLGSLALSLFLGGKRAIPIVFPVVRDDDQSTLFP